MAPKRPDAMTDMVITIVCAKQVAECLVPFLVVLFGAHILSFHE